MKQLIQVGNASNDGTGDTLRQAGIKINSNFNELYQSVSNLGYTLPIASSTVLGGIKVGAGLTIESGVLSSTATNYTLPKATTGTGGTLGGVKVDGTTITINGSGVISASVSIPTAGTGSGGTLGGVKVDGTTITISNGIISSSATGGASVTTSEISPASPTTGDLWYDTNSGRMYVYFDNSWVDSSPVVAETISLTTLQQIVADSINFSDFQNRIAAL